MKIPLFEYPSYQYKVDDWDFKKKGLLNRINQQDFYRTTHNTFETDRLTNNKTYVRYLEDFLRPLLSEFCTEAQVTCGITDAWCVKYKKGDYQTIHNHRGWGFTGILYVKYNPKIHPATCFVAPWQNPRTDTTSLEYPTVEEGTVIITPSSALHYADPNLSKEERIIISFDLLPELPRHQSINKD